jgi:hypothetical protein
MNQLDNSAKSALVADLTVLQSQLERLRKIKDGAENCLAESSWVETAIHHVSIGEWLVAYALWKEHCDGIDGVLGAFAEVTHHSSRPAWVGEQVKQLRDIAQEFLDRDGWRQPGNGTGLALTLNGMKIDAGLKP